MRSWDDRESSSSGLTAALLAAAHDGAGRRRLRADVTDRVIPLYHSFGQTLVADIVQRHARFFQHLSHPAPGRGSTGVHEAGFGRWNPRTLSLSDTAIPTLNVVDDTFTIYRPEMDAVIQEAKRRAGL